MEPLSHRGEFWNQNHRVLSRAEIAEFSRIPTRAIEADGGFLVPHDFALDVQATSEAWRDQDFLEQFFATTLHRYADVTSLADARRRELRSKPSITWPNSTRTPVVSSIIVSEPPQGGGRFYRN